ncbi:MAG: hypothetical protein OSB46_14120 [Alphaproteobacteria bacterium]|nr:hypothetical protein [Alphaproteobacteria bacterium]
MVVEEAIEKKTLADLAWVGGLLKGDLKALYFLAKYYRPLDDIGG